MLLDNRLIGYAALALLAALVISFLMTPVDQDHVRLQLADGLVHA